MRRMIAIGASGALLAGMFAGTLPEAPAASASIAQNPDEGRAAKSGPGTAKRPKAPALTGAQAVKPQERTEVLGKSWSTSTDRAWTISGDGAGLHVLTAVAKTGYSWSSVATLAEDGFAADSWIGNACADSSGNRLVVAYAPRTFTNKDHLRSRGAFVAVVDLVSGKVNKVAMTSSLAYFSPSCGVNGKAVVTQEGGESKPATRLLTIDIARGAVESKTEVPGQLTSAVPTPDGLVGADNGWLVKIAPDGRRTALARTKSVPFSVVAGRDGSVSYLDRTNDDATLHQVSAAAIRTPKGRSAKAAPTLAKGPLATSGIVASADGVVGVLGDLKTAAKTLPTGFRQVAAASTSARLSTTGDVAVEPPKKSVLPPKSAKGDASDLRRTVTVPMIVPATGAKPEMVLTPSGRKDAAEMAVSPAALKGSSRAKAATGQTATSSRAQAGGSPTNPVESERYCSVPRNDPRNQAMQPKPRQVEWAVNQAVRNTLDESRPANWKNLGMPAYTPQGLFPSRSLSGGGYVPSQVFLGIIAQESNMWQAPGSVVPGVTGNPLIGNYYGLQYYDSDTSNDWDINFSKADCGYGVTQITDGMRLAGREKPGETALPYNSQRAAALDFAANVAGGLRILQDKWNQTRGGGLIVNNGDISKIENWFFAVWAYNSGYYPQSQAGNNSGAWGLGWSNNPANPSYKPNRAPFLDRTYEDAAHPQDWPYPEKVMGWAGHPVEILESPGKFVSGYRAAWWNGDEITAPLNRANVKPPVNQFCDDSNSCYPGTSHTGNAPGVEGAAAGPCGHTNGSGQYDLKCWYNKPSTWKANCAYSCGNELLRFSENYAYQDDGAAYPPNCDLNGLPSGALVIDDQPDSVPSVRPGCGRPHTNQGSFSFTFNSDAQGNYPGKADLWQLGGGFAGHFSYTHTRTKDLRGGSMTMTGTWTLNKSLSQWARVFVHLPDHGAHTQQARYEIDLGNGTRKRIALQRVGTNKWVSLGVFPFSGTPKVRLVSYTDDGDDGTGTVENEDVAWDAVAFQPLSAKPKHVVTSLGDSYSSGEGASADGGVDYYPETDNNGGNPKAQNACHRSKYAWSRKATFADSSSSIGSRNDSHSGSLEHQLIACSGAQTENIIPPEVTNDFGQGGRGQFGEVAQLDRGYVDRDTTLVTMSIGGNDSLFVPVVKKCALSFSCPDVPAEEGQPNMREHIPALMQGKVRRSVLITLKEIRKKAPNARILLMGYPELIYIDPNNPQNECTIPGRSPQERLWFNSLVPVLRDALKGAVADANTAFGSEAVFYSDPIDDFSGKGICGNPENIHGIVGPHNKTPGENPSITEVPVSQQSFHPKIDGTTDYARSMNETLRRMGL